MKVLRLVGVGMLLLFAAVCPRRGWRRVVGPGMLLLFAAACPRRGWRRVVGPGMLLLFAAACPRRGWRRVVGPGMLLLFAAACPRRGWRRVVGPGMLLLFAAACKSKNQAGAKCVGELVPICGDPSTELYCDAGSWQPIACKGPDGCRADMAATQGVACDISGNANGDPCVEGPHRSVCSPDKKSRIRCTDKKTEAVACDGPGGCAQEGAKVICSRRPAHVHVGDPCGTENESIICSEDGKAMLGCDYGEYARTADAGYETIPASAAKWRVTWSGDCAAGNRACTYDDRMGANCTPQKP